MSRLRSIRRYKSKKPFVTALDGRKITAVQRKGKYLLVRLDKAAGADGNGHGDVLVVHLGMSGQLRLVDPATPLAAHTHAVFDLDDSSQLRYSNRWIASGGPRQGPREQPVTW